MSTSRKILKNATTSQHAVRDALSIVFTAELVTPSADLFIIAPWISDVSILDNSTGQLQALNPEWPNADIRLVQVFTALASIGTRVHIYTRPDTHNDAFITKFSEAMYAIGSPPGCKAARVSKLHTKGLLTEWALIDGSMNLTFNGIWTNDESVSITTEDAAVAGARIHFESYGQH